MNVSRDLVYNFMKDIFPEGLESRGGVGVSKKKKREKIFLSSVSNYYNHHILSKFLHICIFGLQFGLQITIL